MATATTSLILANDTDAHFRAWPQWIHDRLAAAGWVQTADTGQINLTTVVKPAGVSTSQGNEIWRMDDALQPGHPVFMKIEYGSYITSANNPAIWLTVGTGSNGAGTITGQVGARTHIGCITPSITVPYNVFFSGDTNYFVFALPSDVGVSVQTSHFYFGVERTTDSAGVDNTEGVWWGALYAGTLCAHQMIPFSGGSVPLVETRYMCGLAPQSAQSTGVVGSDANTYPIVPMGFFPRNPVRLWVAYYNTDLTRETPVNLDMYGSTHQFLPLGQPNSAGSKITATDAIAGSAVFRLAMRYE